MNVVLSIIFRWLHIASACCAIGSLLFMRVVVPIAIRQLPEPQRHETFLRLRRGLKFVIHSSIFFLLLSGIYNSVMNWHIYHQIPAQAHPLWGSHVLLALAIFAIALIVLAGDEPPQSHRNLATINLVLLGVTLAVAAGLKYVREHAPPASTNLSWQPATDTPNPTR